VTAADLTAILGSLGGLVVVGIAVLTFIKTNRAAKVAALAAAKVEVIEKEREELAQVKKDDEMQVISWEKLNAALQATNDKQLLALDEIDARYRKKMQVLEDDAQHQLGVARIRINGLDTTVSELNQTVAELTRQLGRLQI
jgi:hypothetical protein